MPARSWYRILRGICITLVAVVAFSLAGRAIIQRSYPSHAQDAAAIDGIFGYTFSSEGILYEAGTPDESSSPYWWLDSGGKLIIENAVGKTLQGTLSRTDRWRGLYARANAADTDDGARPQNLFRLLTRSIWKNVRTEVAFRVTADNASDSPNKNKSNGLLLMSRYLDDDNLYYAGLRIDGHAVIKKKYDGVYFTMIEKPIIEGRGNRLLPRNEWITLGMETRNEDDAVRITLSRKNADGSWEELVSATDSGQFDDTAPIRGTYPVGIRTDFMDVEFDDFKAEEI